MIVTAEAGTLAHVCASLGWRGFPVNAKTKRPLISDFYNRASCNHRKIERWLAQFPGCGWAIITGADGGVIGLDIDRKYDARGKVITWALESLHRAGVIYRSATTPTARTPSG